MYVGYSKRERTLLLNEVNKVCRLFASIISSVLQCHLHTRRPIKTLVSQFFGTFFSGQSQCCFVLLFVQIRPSRFLSIRRLSLRNPDYGEIADGWRENPT